MGGAWLCCYCCCCCCAEIVHAHCWLDTLIDVACWSPYEATRVTAAALLERLLSVAPESHFVAQEWLVRTLHALVRSAGDKTVQVRVCVCVCVCVCLRVRADL